MRVLLVAGFFTLFMCGCNSNFRYDGIPHDQFYVGGGNDFEYKAKETGHIYVVDAFFDKLLLMRPLEAGEVLDKDELDLDKDKDSYALYFIPARQAIVVKE